MVWQNSFSFLRLQSYEGTIYLSQETAEIPDIGIVDVVGEGYRAINVWLPQKLQIGGSIEQWQMGATGTPATSPIIYCRSTHRFIFSRVFGRIN